MAAGQSMKIFPPFVRLSFGGGIWYNVFKDADGVGKGASAVSVDVLQGKIRKKKNPTVVSLRLRADRLPPEIEGTGAAGVEAQGRALLEGLADLVPAVKFPMTYFEVLGPEGLAVLGRLCALARKLGYYVFLETDRCDLEPAAELAARAAFGGLEPGGAPPLWEADAVVLDAFTGSDGVRPYLPHCRVREKSVFLLARTANKSARELQDLLAGDRVVHTVVADLAMRLSTDLFGKGGYSQVGILLDAVRARAFSELRQRYDRLFFLVPAGPAVREARGAFDKFGHGAILEDDAPAHAWQASPELGLVPAARAAAEKRRDEIAQAVTVI